MTDTSESAPAVAASVSASSPLATAMTETVWASITRPFSPLLDGTPPEQGMAGRVDAVFTAINGALALPGALLETSVATLTSAILPPGNGFPAATLLSGLHLGLPHYHPTTVASGVPLPGVGPAVLVGALDVTIGGLPALRCGDIGFAFGCTGAPNFEVSTGSSNVFVGGKRAARTLDFTRHCNPLPLLGGPTNPIGSSLGLFSVATMGASAVAHCVAACTDAGQAGTSPDAELRAGGELRQAVTGVAQSLADMTLSPLAAVIGLNPPVGLTGDGMILSGSPNVLIGGLPIPPIGDVFDTQLHDHVRRLAHGAAVRALRSIPEGSALHCRVYGEPVDAVNGSVFSDHLDVDLGLGLAFGRHYDSRAHDRVGDVGRGMRHVYERELEVWLHRCSYVDQHGVRVDFPAFRGRARVALGGYVLTRAEGHRYEVTHAGETMVFASTSGARAARLVEIRSAETTRTLEQDASGRFRAVRVSARGLFAERNAEGRIVCVRDERGLERASYAYERGCLVATRDAEAHEERFEYDASHRLVGWRDARGYRFSWRYDEAGRCVHTSGEDRQWWCDFAYEKLKTTVTHASGLTEALHYDAYGTVLRVVRSDGGVLLREQDASGRIVRERDAAGRVVELSYDESGALVGRCDRFGHDVSPSRDAPSPRARRLPAALPGRLGIGALAGARAVDVAIPEELEALAAWALAAFETPRTGRVENDALGRPIRLVDARGRGVELRRDAAGNVIERKDRDRRTTRALITGWNLVGAEIDPLGRRVEATYTTTEEVRSYRDPLGVLTEYGRDAADRLVSITRAGRLRESYVHDAAGLLVAKKDAHGEPLLRVTHHANALPGRIALAVGGTIELDYDSRGRVTRARLGEHDARLERDESGTVLFDRCGERGLRRWSFATREVTSVFERFETSITRQDGRIVVRDPTGGLTSFDASAGGRVVRHVANGTHEILAFDPEGRLQGRLAHRRASDGALASWAVRYERSGEGDLLGVWDSARGERRFEIDAAHRLAAEIDERGERHAYVLDADDDVVAKPGVAHADFDDAGVLLRTERESFEHDGRGRMSSRRDASGRTLCYAYDSLDQLVEVDLGDGGSPWRGSYDGLGRLRRFGREGAGATLHWDGDRIAAELAQSGALRVHVYAHARALIPFAFIDYPSVDAEPESGRAYYVFHDASGMPTQIEDASGRTVWWADRVDPYGALTLHEGAELDYALRWPGHYFDRDLGLHHNRFRAYDPGLARYLQPDPIGHAGSPHGLYAYAPNPLVHVDLLGLHTDERPRPAHATDEEGEGHPLHEDPPDSFRDPLNRLRDRLGRFLEDPLSLGREPPNLRCTRTDITTGLEASIASDPRAQAHLVARRAALERARAATSDHERAAALADARGHSERLGVMATSAEMTRRYPGAECIHEGHGAGTFDSVWRVPGRPPSYVVAESKGGSARESSSRLLPTGDRAQQGTPEYRQDIQRSMASSSDPEVRRVAAALEGAGGRISYLGVSQPVRRGGGALGSIRVVEYGPSQAVPRNATAPPPTTSP